MESPLSLGYRVVGGHHLPWEGYRYGGISSSGTSPIPATGRRDPVCTVAMLQHRCQSADQWLQCGEPGQLSVSTSDVPDAFLPATAG